MSDDRPGDDRPTGPDPTNPWATPAPRDEPTSPLPYGQGDAAPPPPSYAPQPYGAPQPPQPYGAPQQYGAPAPGTGYAPNPDSAAARSSATLWLILNILSVLFCSNLPGIVGAIFAGLALGRAEVDPADARRKVRTSKIWFFAGLVLALVVIVVVGIALIATGLFENGSGDPFSTSDI